MNKNQDLGRGIRALLDDINEDWTGDDDSGAGIKTKAHSIDIPLEDIEVNPFQPRADFDAEGLTDLSESIKVHGIIQPITVRSLGAGKFQLIAGERRLRASKIAGIAKVPAYVREANDREMLEIALIENIQREDLNAIEVAINFQRLMDECSITQEKLGERVGKNRSTITNYLRLLKLPPVIQQGIKEKKMSMGHARAIINIEDPAIQLGLYKDILENELSVRSVELLTKKINRPKKKKNKGYTSVPLAYQKIQEELSSLIGTKVKMKPTKGESGEIIISFFSDGDLDRILTYLTKS